MNLQPTDVPHPHDGILGIGDPANAGDILVHVAEGSTLIAVRGESKLMAEAPS